MKYKLKNYFLHYGGTTIHKVFVFWYIGKFCINMLWRSLIHDLSKYSWNESEGFIKTIDRLKSTTYGTKQYQKLLDDTRISIDHHYKKNSHHPEHYPNGIEDMSLQDIVEMFCDWQAAVKRHKDGNIMSSIASNQDRFDIPFELSEIFRNTVCPRKSKSKIHKELNPI